MESIRLAYALITYNGKAKGWSIDFTKAGNMQFEHGIRKGKIQNTRTLLTYWVLTRIPQSF